MPTAFVGRARALDVVQRGLERGLPIMVCGLPGIGKTALIRKAGEVAAQDGADVLYLRCRNGETAPSLIEEALSEVGATSRDRVGSGWPAFDRWLRRLEGDRLLLCVDDLHVAHERMATELVPPLLRRGVKVVMASRTKAVRPEALDFQVVPLEPLTAEESSALWDELVKLYGEVAMNGQRGQATTPFLLRSLFGGAQGAGGADPFNLDVLSDDERTLLAVVVAHRGESTRALLRDVLGEKVDRGLPRLLARMLVERRSSEVVAAHDLVREALEDHAPEVIRSAHRRLLAYQQSRPLRVRGQPIDSEELYHAVRSDREQARTMLETVAATGFGLAFVGSVLEREVGRAIAELASDD
ncbi:MAG: ATP-binding protein, partial [Myxococcota bacterium]